MAGPNDWYPIGPAHMGMPDVREVDTVRKFPEGYEAQFAHNIYGVGKFVYLPGVASVVRGDWVTWNNPREGVVRAVADAEGNIGVAMAAIVANRWGWFQVGGDAWGNVLTAFAATGTACLTSTAGSLDDTVVTGDEVLGAIARSAIIAATDEIAFDAAGTPASVADGILLNGVENWPGGFSVVGMARFTLVSPFVDDIDNIG